MAVRTRKQLEGYLHAFALGCLDPDDYIALIEYLARSENYPWQELGEYQNLACLLPSFMNIKSPPSVVKVGVMNHVLGKEDLTEKRGATTSFKDKVTGTSESHEPEQVTDQAESTAAPAPEAARIKPQRPQHTQIAQREEKNGAEAGRPVERPSAERPAHEGRGGRPAYRKAPEQPGPDEAYDEEYNEVHEEELPAPPDEEINQSEEHYTTEGGTEVYSRRETRGRPPGTEHLQHEYRERQIQQAVKNELRRFELEQRNITLEAVEKGNVSNMIFWVIIVVMLIIMGGIYFLLSEQINEINIEQNRLQTASKSVNINQELLFFMTSSREVRLTNLRGEALYPNAYGKFLYKPRTATALLQVTNMFALGESMGFQLWAEIDGEFTRIGPVVKPTQNTEHFMLTGIPEVFRDTSIALVVTQENTADPADPSSAICLRGNYIP